ncbi:flavin reductase family protein [Hyphococcus flavus]|uniref:Flavin reductase family protein n=1 Tax=Hyphococcus flavus TaxID=1866326 RepID=A0AAE9ZH19_9PROT|nr:flavin reductase family protein [Hyphococcus flavus]WDI30696.1 flavin reductase family protein [Hyphococcus flavus]
MTDKYRPLKDALGRFATGIAVAACRNGDGEIKALTINSFTSVSLDPPLVLWCLENRASSYSSFMSADAYSVNVLRADQRQVSDHFAGFLPDPIGEEGFEAWKTGAPVLKEHLAAFDCKIVARHDAGDHVVLVGAVEQFSCNEGKPLIYYASNYYQGTD